MSDILKQTIEKLEREFPGKTVLNINDMAAALDCEVASIYNLLRKNSTRQFPIKPRRIGRKLRWNLIDLAEYLSGE